MTCSSSARLRCRNGPPLAVSTSLATSPADPPRRHCAIAECSESTGTIWPGRARPATSGPPVISDSLFASASTRPARSAARVAARPLNPVTALSTTSQGQAAASATPSGPASTFGCVPGALRAQGLADRGGGLLALDGHHLGPELDRLAGQQAGVAAAGRQPGDPEPAGLRRMTSAAWVPIDPVEPSRTTLRGPPREDSTPPLCPVLRCHARVGPPAPVRRPPFRAPPNRKSWGVDRMRRVARWRLLARAARATRQSVPPTAPSPGAAASPSWPAAPSLTPRIWCSATTLRSKPSREPAMYSRHTRAVPSPTSATASSQWASRLAHHPARVRA